jgi:hypothetical protein
MRTRLDDRGSEQSAARSGRARVQGAPALLLVLAVATLSAAGARADGPFSESPFAFGNVEGRYGSIPERFQYVEERESRPPSVSFRRNELRAVEAPTRYRTSSILKYTTPIGDTGMEFRVKLPLKPTKIVKLELRF